MKRTVKSTSVAVLFVCLIAAGMLLFGDRAKSNTGIITPALAQEFAKSDIVAQSRIRHCTIGTISGSYAYTASGAITQPIPQLQIPAGPYAVTGLITLDRGNLTFKSTQSFNGTLVPTTGTGTYQVNDDCTGTAVDNLGTPYSFVIADGGNELKIMLTIPGTVITGVAHRL